MTAATTAVRGAVREALADLPHGERVVVGCSGGADSLALAAATAWVGERTSRPVAAVVVDHGLVEGSAQVARSTAAQCRQLGLSPVIVKSVSVVVSPGGAGPEAAARDARRAALTEVAVQMASSAVLLGHTRDDQAETVLLGLARGSGARSLAGMRPINGLFRRPMLGLSRATVRQSVVDLGLTAHDDPQNLDPAFARVRVRSTALPVLEEQLGPGIAAALARSADLLRDDADLLDLLALDALADLREDPSMARLAELPAALRSRVVRLLAAESGCPVGDLTRDHVRAIERMVMSPRVRGPVHLPAGYLARRDCGRLIIDRSATPPRAKES